MKRRDERGVTLSELLIAITITTIIMGPIAGAIFVGLRTSGATQSRVQESSSANLLSTYFTPDVENAVAVATNATESACPAPQTVALLLTTVAGSQGSSVSYYRGIGPQTNYLYRRVCTNGVASSTSAIARSVLPGAGPGQGLNFQCAPACDATWTSVTATVSQQNQFDSAPFIATVTAARRVS